MSWMFWKKKQDQLTFDISSQKADQLLKRLVEDQAFRKQVEHDPARALASYGIQLSGSHAARTTLPPADELKALLGPQGTFNLMPIPFSSCTIWAAIAYCAAARQAPHGQQTPAAHE